MCGIGSSFGATVKNEDAVYLSDEELQWAYDDVNSKLNAKRIEEKKTLLMRLEEIEDEAKRRDIELE